MKRRGFTLLEVMVALIILGAAAAVLLPEIVAGSRAVDRARERWLLSSVATSVMERVGAGILIVSGETRGVETVGEQRVAWQVNIAQEHRSRPPGAPPEALRLYRVTVAVSLRDDPRARLALVTLRAVP